MADEIVKELEVTEESTALVLGETQIVATHQAVAMSAEDMMRAQITVKDFLGAKLVGLDSELAELQATYEAAVKHKWKSSGFARQLSRLRAKRQYYAKLLSACEAGYTIVPNMDCNVFAIRVKRALPKEWDHSGNQNYEPYAPHLRDEVEDSRLNPGVGRYENPKTTSEVKRGSFTASDGKLMHWARSNAVDFLELEFPLAIATPLIMEATTAAMQKKIFDRIGIVNGSTYTTRTRKGDPIVVGQIRLKESYGWRTATFLIAWYLDPRTL